MIREIRNEDVQAYLKLRHEALAGSPLAFASSIGDDFASKAENLREQIRLSPESVLFGAFADELIGTVGLYRDRHLKFAHKVHLWGMYVSPEHRHGGIGSGLLKAALAHARKMPGVVWVHLSVSSAAPAARKLYEQAGFQEWGTEPDALRHDGQTVDDHHMALKL